MQPGSPRPRAVKCRFSPGSPGELLLNKNCNPEGPFRCLLLLEGEPGWRPGHRPCWAPLPPSRPAHRGGGLWGLETFRSSLPSPSTRSWSEKCFHSRSGAQQAALGRLHSMAPSRSTSWICPLGGPALPHLTPQGAPTSTPDPQTPTLFPSDLPPSPPPTWLSPASTPRTRVPLYTHSLPEAQPGSHPSQVPETPRTPSSRPRASLRRPRTRRSGEGAREGCARRDLRAWEWEGREDGNGGPDHSFYRRLNVIFFKIKILKKSTSLQGQVDFHRLSLLGTRLVSQPSIPGPCAGGSLHALRPRGKK